MTAERERESLEREREKATREILFSSAWKPHGFRMDLPGFHMDVGVALGRGAFTSLSKESVLSDHCERAAEKSVHFFRALYTET